LRVVLTSNGLSLTISSSPGALVTVVTVVGVIWAAGGVV